MTKETEKQILKHVAEVSKKLGLRCLRISMRPGVEAGWADTFVFAPNRNLLAVETKSPGKEATPLQMKRARELSAFGFGWCKCDSRKDVEWKLYNFACYSVGRPLMTREEFDVMEPLKELTVH